MVMTIRNMCRMFDNLFQLVGNREMKSLNFPNISVGGLEPVSVVYIEVSNLDVFALMLERCLQPFAKQFSLDLGNAL